MKNCVSSLIITFSASDAVRRGRAEHRRGEILRIIRKKVGKCRNSSDNLALCKKMRSCESVFVIKADFTNFNLHFGLRCDKMMLSHDPESPVKTVCELCDMILYIM